MLRDPWHITPRSQLLSHEIRIIFCFINLGAENFVIDQISHISVCQILIEIHGNVLATVNGKAKVVDHFDANKVLSILQSVSRQGFYLFSYEFLKNVCL